MHPSSSFGSMPYLGARSFSHSLTPMRFPVHYRTRTPYLSRRTYYPVRELDNYNDFVGSISSFKAQKTRSLERTPVSVGSYTLDFWSRPIEPNYFYRRSSTHEYFEPSTSPVIPECSLRQNLSLTFYSNSRDLYETNSRHLRGNSPSPSLSTNVAECWDTVVRTACGRDSCGCQILRKKTGKLLETDSCAKTGQSKERNQKKQTDLEHWISENNENTFCSSLNIVLQRQPRTDCFDKCGFPISNNRQRSSQLSAQAFSDIAGNKLVLSPISTASYSGISSSRGTCGTVNKISCTPQCRRRSYVSAGTWSTSAASFAAELRSTFMSRNDCLPKKVLPPTSVGSNSLETSAAKQKTVKAEACIQIGTLPRSNQNSVQSKIDSARMRPPLPPNPPSKSRLLRYSQSVNERRKQRVAVPLNSSFHIEFIDGFQSSG